jgi:scyllo-inositol 2-dehydrogenase (NADP+)
MQTINTALLSFGMSGWVFHAPFIDVHEGFAFSAVWERSKNLAQDRYPGVKTFRSLDDLLADPGIELVVVNTPNYTHFDYTRRALEAGKNVIVEKPFTVTVAEGEELLALAEEKGLLLSVYHNRRFDSDYKVVKRVVDEGLLGTIVEAEFHFDRYKEDLSPKVHKETPGPGTGALYDLGSHLIDQALQLFGMPEAVFADIRVVRQASHVDDYFEVLLYYPDKRVRLHSSYLVREALPAYQLHGTKGSFIKTKSDVQETDLQANRSPADPAWGREPDAERGLLHTERDGSVRKEFLPSESGRYLAYYDGIYQALRHQGPNPVPAADGLDVIRVITAAFESNETKKVTSL